MSESERVTELSEEETDAVSGGGWGDDVSTSVYQSNSALNVSANIALYGSYVSQYSSTYNNQYNSSNVVVYA